MFDSAIISFEVVAAERGVGRERKLGSLELLAPLFFMTKEQTEAAKYIRDLLASRNLQTESGIFLIGEEGWHVFEHNQKCIGIDPSSSIWVGPSGGQWRQISKTCTVSGALEAIELLIGD